MKKWLVALAVLVVLLASGAVFLLSSLNGIVVKTVNEEGPKYTGTTVHLDKADISLLSGTGTFSGLTLGNPEGFSGPWAAKVGSAAVVLDTGTVFDDTIVIPSIVIESPELVYELGKKSSNFETILRNIRARDKSDAAETSSSGAAAAGDAEKKAKKKVIIDTLTISNARATLSIPEFRLSVTVPLPEIRLTDIGRKSRGATMAEAGAIVLEELTKKLSENAADQTKNAGALLLKGGEKAAGEAKTVEEKARNLLKEGFGAFRK